MKELSIQIISNVVAGIFLIYIFEHSKFRSAKLNGNWSTLTNWKFLVKCILIILIPSATFYWGNIASIRHDAEKIKIQEKAIADLNVHNHELVQKLDSILLKSPANSKQKPQSETTKNSDRLTAQLYSAGLRGDSLLVDLLFSNQGSIECYIPEIFFNVHKIFLPPIDLDSHKQIDVISIRQHEAVYRKFLFNLRPRINEINLLNADFPIYDTCEIGIYAHFTGMKKVGNVIKNIIISTQNGKITELNTSTAKIPIVIIGK
jgi:hypothetical protein